MQQRTKQNKAMANIVNDKEALKINLDVRHFSPDELSVKVVEDFVEVEGKHEEKDDEHGAVSRHFVRRYRLDSKVDKAAIISSLSSDGILQIHAQKCPPSEEDEREVPITLTNLPALEPDNDGEVGEGDE
ncbi:alpha-crystallin A chain-like [Macrosteles quadrilineatus]|uniref:alpha-crystallin A chain-like n=1 Tax=Macrosteles quadrilineatus TaxID=74068 RepID=UPI0023E0C699|nr:alpha-crystallin A chain-like [Macrosteles quadrilineatus]